MSFCKVCCVFFFFPEYNLKHVQEHGFNWPMLFRDKTKLGIQIPNSDFSINDVRLCVGKLSCIVSIVLLIQYIPIVLLG